jgi:hypothetical protein
MKNQQLEIGLKSTKCNRRISRRQQRLARARWWFNQMRRVVDEAVEWKPASPSTERSGLPLAPGR